MFEKDLKINNSLSIKQTTLFGYFKGLDLFISNKEKKDYRYKIKAFYTVNENLIEVIHLMITFNMEDIMSTIKFKGIFEGKWVDLKYLTCIDPINNLYMYETDFGNTILINLSKGKPMAFNIHKKPIQLDYSIPEMTIANEILLPKVTEIINKLEKDEKKVILD